MKKLLMTTMVAAMALSVQALGANLIVNGSFEDPDVANNTWAVFTAVDGWTIEWTTGSGDRGPELEVWDPTVVAGVEAYDGEQCVELDSYDPTKFSQVVTATAGLNYQLNYAWRPRPGVNCQMDVLVNGAVIASHSGNSGDWQLETYAFTASSDSTTIAFAETGLDDQLGMLLDGVSLVNTEPVGRDSATGIGARILPKGTWFMYNSTYGITWPGVGGNLQFQIQAGNPDGGLKQIGFYVVWNRGGGWYEAEYVIDPTIEINGVEYEIVVTDEHLAVSDSMNFTAKPGQDDNQDFEVPFYDADGQFYIFAHVEVEYW